MIQNIEDKDGTMTSDQVKSIEQGAKGRTKTDLIGQADKIKRIGMPRG